MEQMEERRLGGIQISSHLPASGFPLTPSKQNLSKYNLFLCRIQKSFKGIVSNQDFFFQFQNEIFITGKEKANFYIQI